MVIHLALNGWDTPCYACGCVKAATKYYEPAFLISMLKTRDVCDMQASKNELSAITNVKEAVWGEPILWWW